MQADKNRKEKEFNVGDYVPTLQPYRQSLVVQQPYLKFSSHFYGPYYVLEQAGLVTYCLFLPKGSLVLNVFHISLLKKHEGHVPTITVLPSLFNPKILQGAQREQVLDNRVIQKGKYSSL